jgi:hypothetical protein
MEMECIQILAEYFRRIIPLGRYVYRRKDKEYAIDKWSRIMWTGLIWLRMLVFEGI